MTLTFRPHEPAATIALTDEQRRIVEWGEGPVHAIYGEFEVEIAIQTLELLQGELPPRALGLTMEWAGLHRDELMVDWALAAAHQRLRRIDPLR